MIKDMIKKKLEDLIKKYKEFIKTANKDNITEETIRTWLNEMLLIFGWNVQNTAEVLQEKKLVAKNKKKLEMIKSSHNKPDYILMNGANIKAFLDAKDLKVNINTDKEVAFQIRSYGWSSDVPCSFISNFEEFAIHDCRFIPKPEQEANFGRIYLKVDEYLDNFDILYNHLYKANIISGKLEELYSAKVIEGVNRLDEYFMGMLANFRMSLAKNIQKNNMSFISDDSIRLNYYVQVIMDRIIFIRVCESRGIEKEEKLKEFLKEGFWKSFNESCYMEFYEHYDGAMFDRDANIHSLNVDNYIFEEFINNLYYPSPYKFDVIPVKVIAGIYEYFLSKQLEIVDGSVVERYKKEYVKTQGAISTPHHIVENICKLTIKFEDYTSIESLLSIDILDPACGSGTFLITCFELIELQLINLYKLGNLPKKYNGWFVAGEDGVYLTVDAKREIIKNCIYGIDCDETAVEVAKMSLALKIIDGNDLLVLNEVGVFGRKILHDVHNNIKLGNTLVRPDITLEKSELLQINPFDIEKKGFAEVFRLKGGFDYIVGNPPYVETKHYKNNSPKMHKYLSTKYKTFAGKADLAILFIERCIELLNTVGKLGFIIQKRFFKTDYGKKIRKLISQNKYLMKMIDFKTEKLFNGRLTYVAIVVLDKNGSDNLEYEYITKEPLQIQYLLENKKSLLDSASQRIKIPAKYITENPWSFESYALLEIISKLRESLGVLGEFPKLYIKDGVQALWKKLYHFTDYKIKGEHLYGKNGFNEDVKIEIEMVKGIIYNTSFYCFKNLEPDAYCLFPYEGCKLRTKIPMSVIKKKYPLTYKYLKDNETRIKENVRHFDDNEIWHTFTREHNHETFNENKIIWPMTALDTIATFVNDKGLYMDNSNVWFIKINGSNDKIMKVITAIINSTAFSVFAKAGANPQSNGYYKLNKQFMMPVPFPIEGILNNADVVNSLDKLYDLISKGQDDYRKATANRKETIRDILNGYWNDLDNIVYSLYGLKGDDLDLVKSIGRTTDRVELI